MTSAATIRLAFSMLALLILSTCGKTPRNVEDLSNKIRTVSYSVEDDVKIIRIELDGVFGSDEAHYFFRASQEMSKILRKLAAYFPEDQQQVNFILKARLQNTYGKTSDRVVLEVPFSMSEVRKSTYFTPTNWDLLNMSEEVRYAHPIGRNIVHSFCTVENYQKHASRFCLAAL